VDENVETLAVQHLSNSCPAMSSGPKALCRSTAAASATSFTPSGKRFTLDEVTPISAPAMEQPRNRLVPISRNLDGEKLRAAPEASRAAS
jgi:hypothetical protein